MLPRNVSGTPPRHRTVKVPRQRPKVATTLPVANNKLLPPAGRPTPTSLPHLRLPPLHIRPACHTSHPPRSARPFRRRPIRPHRRLIHPLRLPSRTPLPPYVHLPWMATTGTPAKALALFPIRLSPLADISRRSTFETLLSSLPKSGNSPQLPLTLTIPSHMPLLSPRTGMTRRHCPVPSDTERIPHPRKSSQAPLQV